jgi:hypothetical protein
MAGQYKIIVSLKSNSQEGKHSGRAIFCSIELGNLTFMLAVPTEE